MHMVEWNFVLYNSYNKVLNILLYFVFLEYLSTEHVLLVIGTIFVSVLSDSSSDIVCLIVRVSTNKLEI